MSAKAITVLLSRIYFEYIDLGGLFRTTMPIIAASIYTGISSGRMIFLTSSNKTLKEKLSFKDVLTSWKKHKRK